MPSSFGVHVDMDGQSAYVLADFERPSWSVRWYWDHLDLNFWPRDAHGVPSIFIGSDAQDIEIQHVFQPDEHHLIVSGASYRRKTSPAPALLRLSGTTPTP